MINLKDLERVVTLTSSEVSSSDLEIVKEPTDRFYTVVDKKEAKNMTRLGEVSLIDENGNPIRNFILLKYNGKYIIYMRRIYMMKN